MLALVDDVLGARDDAAVVRPVLTAMIQTSIQDFDRYYRSRYASTRVRDTELVIARERQKKKLARVDRQCRERSHSRTASTD